MEESPLVSIVLQTYNRKDLLSCALESAKNQTYKNIEILIGDNHSEDGTEEYCLEQAKLDNRIKYFRHSENIGMTGNANFLLERVSGEFFIFLNDDDWLDLDYVEKCIEFICEKPDYSMVCPSTILYQKDRENIRKKNCKIAKLNDNNVYKRLKTYLINQDALEMSTGCFRTSILRQIKEAEGQFIFDRYNEDVVFEMKFIAAGKCQMLSKTHLNKRDSGFSKDVKTSDKIYSANHLTLSMVKSLRCKIFPESIINDKFYTKLFNEEQCKNLSKKIYIALAIFHKQGFCKPLWLYCYLKDAFLIIYHFRKLYRL